MKTISKNPGQTLDLGAEIPLNHPLNPFLPPLQITHYNLRKRGHNITLPIKDNRNFITRCLYEFK